MEEESGYHKWRLTVWDGQAGRGGCRGRNCSEVEIVSMGRGSPAEMEDTYSKCEDMEMQT